MDVCPGQQLESIATVQAQSSDRLQHASVRAVIFGQAGGAQHTCTNSKKLYTAMMKQLMPAMKLSDADATSAQLASGAVTLGFPCYAQKPVRECLSDLLLFWPQKKLVITMFNNV